MAILISSILGKLFDPLLWVLVLIVFLIIKRPREGMIAAVGIGVAAQALAFALAAPLRIPNPGLHLLAAAVAGSVVYGVMLGARRLYRRNMERDDVG